MKHLLNNMTEAEKNAIREQHTGGMKVMTEKFSKLIETKLGDVKPITEQINPQSPVLRCSKNKIKDELIQGFNKLREAVSKKNPQEIDKAIRTMFDGKYYVDKCENEWKYAYGLLLNVIKAQGSNSFSEWVNKNVPSNLLSNSYRKSSINMVKDMDAIFNGTKGMDVFMAYEGD